jgi:hypothetical protein
MLAQALSFLRPFLCACRGGRPGNLVEDESSQLEYRYTGRNDLLVQNRRQLVRVGLAQGRWPESQQKDAKKNELGIVRVIEVHSFAFFNEFASA